MRRDAHPAHLDTKHAKNLHRALTLAELEALPCLRLARFLSLYGTRVASHEAFCTESRFVFRIDLHQRAAYRETQCFCLTLVATAVEVSHDVILAVYLKSVQRLLHYILKYRRRKIIVERALVDCDLSVTLCEIYSGHCCLTATDCINFIHLPYLILLISMISGFLSSM